MAYEKTEWKGRQGVNLNRFEKSQQTDKSVVLENVPSEITQQGTPFSTANMNHMEQGIFEAHAAVEAEAQARIQGDNDVHAAIQAEGQARIQGDNDALEIMARLARVKPADPIAYWSMDDVGMPDDPAGTVYRNDRGWSGWNYNPLNGAITKENGIIRIIGNAYMDGMPGSMLSQDKLVVLCARWIGSSAPERLILNGTHDRITTPVITRDWAWYVTSSGDDYVDALYAANRGNQSGFEVSDMYVGNGAYLTPLIDNSGNGHHVPLTGRVVPAQGRFGQGLRFLMGGDMLTDIHENIFTSDFTMSIWIKSLADIHANIVMVSTPDDDGFTILLVDNSSMQMQFFGEYIIALSSDIKINEWFHYLIRKSGDNVIVKINNKTAYEKAVTIGDANTNGRPNFGWNNFDGILDEIAIFDRALTDGEITALYQAPMPRNMIGVNSVFPNPILPMQSHLWPADGSEVDLGGGMFGRRFTGTISAAAKNATNVPLVAIMNLNEVGHHEGWFTYNNIGHTQVIGGTYAEGVTVENSSCVRYAGNSVFFTTSSIDDRTNAPYDVRIRYTKI